MGSRMYEESIAGKGGCAIENIRKLKVKPVGSEDGKIA
jgi:hypothetical protein